MQQHTTENRKHGTPKLIERGLLISRYLLVPMYYGLIGGLVLYNLAFFKELFEMTHDFWHAENVREFVLLGVLGLLDAAMIANLTLMVILGSHSIFVSEVDNSLPHLPRFLKGLTSGMLKVKMGGSLVSVTSIHLLTDFMNTHVTWDELLKRAFVHILFIISAYVFAKMEDLAHPVKATEPEH